ncbi:MAG: D-amino-acid dehydrogenase [Verrucomicrobiota bacterium]|nr:D-amino-acid dehydrogenase [Verrucomicrobiota bacterium]
MRAAKSVIICGGGIVGLCTAYYLAREGLQVTMVERQAGPGHDHCALGSAGYISPSHVIPLAAPGMVWKGLKWMMDSRSPFYIQPRLDTDLMRWGWLFWRASNHRQVARAAPVLRDLCLQSRALYEELDDLTGDRSEFRKDGLLNLCRTQESLDDAASGLARIANALGVEARVLNATQTADLGLGVKLDVAGSVYFPIDAHLTPAKFCAALSGLLAEMGVQFRWNTTIYGWRAPDRRISAVQTTAGELIADEFVLAGGSWSGGMAAGLGLRLPMQAGKGYSLTLPNPRFRITKPFILKERRVAVTPMGDTLRFGGTMEIAGHHDRVRPERVEQIIAAARAYMPEFTAADFDGVRPWFGFRPVSPDGLPYIGRFQRYRNLTTACGHAMLGVTLAPGAGRLIADFLCERKPSVDLTLLNPDRYA